MFALRKNLRKHKALLAILVVLVFFLSVSVAFGAEEKNPLGPIEEFIYMITTGIGGLFLYVGGSLLDYAIQYLVIGMGGFLKANLGVVVDRMWVVVRDLFNIMFIFGLIYIGFRTILFSNDSNTKKAVGYLVVAALMINFSLFITKAIIDFSNIAAFQIHNAIIDEGRAQNATLVTGASVSGGEVNQDSVTTTTVGDGDTPSISAAFMNAIDITTYADGSAIKQIRQDAEVISGRFIFFGILMMFFMMFAAFVFAAGAFILITRFVVLVFAMILSPVMFLGMIFPRLGQYGKDWWGIFLKNAFVAPAYLFMIYLSLWAISGISDPDGGSFSGAFLTNQAGDQVQNGTFFIVLYFFVVTGFLIASLYVAKRMSVYGGEAAMKMVSSTGKFIRTEAQGMAGRNMIGRPMDWWSRNREASGKSERSTFSRLASKGANAKFGSMDSRKEIRESDKKAAGVRGKNKVLSGISDKIAAGAASGASDAEKIDMEQAISNANTEHLIEIIKDKDPNSEEFKTIIGSLTDSQFDAATKDMDGDLKNEVINARTITTKKRLTENLTPDHKRYGVSDLTAAIKTQASPKELSILGHGALMQNAEYIPDGKMNDLEKHLTQTQFRNLKNKRQEKLKNLNGFNIKQVLHGQKPKDIANMPKEVIFNKDVKRFLSSAVLEEIGRAGILSPGERVELKRELLASAHTPLEVRNYLNNPRQSDRFYG